MFKPINGEMISSDFEFSKLDNTLSIQKYVGNKKVVYVREVIGVPIVRISSRSFKKMDETKVIILDKCVLEIEPNAFPGIENVVVYTELQEDDVEFNIETNKNVTFRFGLKMIYDIEYVFYARFDDGKKQYATIFDHHLLDNLYLSDGRFGEQVQLEDDVKGVDVTIIEAHALEYVFNVERYLLPQHCKVIGKSCFRMNTELVSIWTNDELVEICDFSLSKCRNLRELIIDKSVRVLGKHILFDSPISTIYVRDLKSINAEKHFNSGRPVYNNFKEFNFYKGIDYALLGENKAIACDGTRLEDEEVVVPKNIQVNQTEYEVIGLSPACFKGNKYIKDIVLSNTIEYLGEASFMESEVRKITIEGAVKTIPIDFANNAVFLEEVYIPSGVFAILDRAFFYAEKLTRISLPNSITLLGCQSFVGTTLTSLILPTNLRSIQEDALVGTDIRFLVIPEGVKKLPTFSLGDMRALRTLVFLSEDIRLSKHVITERSMLSIIYKGNDDKLRDHILNIGEGYVNVINRLQELSYYNGIIYGLFDNNELSVIGYNSGELNSEVIIPAKIENYPVTGMLDYCLAGCDIISLYISDSIVDIGDYILKDSKIMKLRLPYDLKSDIEHWRRGNTDVVLKQHKFRYFYEKEER